MEKITEILDKLDLTKFVPKLDSLIDWVLQLTKFAVRVGPMCILILGLIYLLLPPNEANRKAGYRTYFGMGSVIAWRFTQRISGLIMTVVGLFLNGAAKKAAEGFSMLDPDAMIETAFALIKTQIIWAIVIFVFMFLLTAVLFKRNGDYRIKALENTGLFRLLTCDVPKTVKQMLRAKKKGQHTKPESFPVPAEVPTLEEAQDEAVTYERQGEQNITADDIVIDYL